MRQEHLHKKLRRSFLKHLWGFLYRIVYRVKIKKECELDPNEPYVFCANHLSYMDALGILVTNKRKIQFVAKMELYHNKILFNWAKVFDIIPVRRNTADINSVKLCLKVLKNNGIVGIFPEGMRHGLDKNAEIKNGAALLASKAKVKVVPIGINASFKPFTKVIYSYGTPIDVNSFKSDDPNWLNNASDHIMNEIIRLAKEVINKVNHTNNYYILCLLLAGCLQRLRKIIKIILRAFLRKAARFALRCRKA